LFQVCTSCCEGNICNLPLPRNETDATFAYKSDKWAPTVHVSDCVLLVGVIRTHLVAAPGTMDSGYPWGSQWSSCVWVIGLAVATHVTTALGRHHGHASLLPRVTVLLQCCRFTKTPSKPVCPQYGP
jgi:hypothetical protein